MNESELRIGNLISYNGEPVELRAISKAGLCNVSKFKHYQDQLEMDLNDFKPIPINDEWLVKTGYQYANENGQKFYWHTDLPYFQLRIDEAGEWLMYYSIHDIPEDILITYAGLTAFHHLQNLHFTLTGNELTIK